MFLYLVQHGEAKKEEEDPQRGLTDKGFRDVTLAALYAEEHGIQVDRIMHSDKTRAMQTAQVLADRLKPGRGICQANDLAPMDDPAIWSKGLSETQEDVMLVGHLPYLAKLAGLLLCGDKEKMFVDFKMGGIVCLKRSDDGRWTLEWMVVPGMVG